MAGVPGTMTVPAGCLDLPPPSGQSMIAATTAPVAASAARTTHLLSPGAFGSCAALAGFGAGKLSVVERFATIGNAAAARESATSMGTEVSGVETPDALPAITGDMLKARTRNHDTGEDDFRNITPECASGVPF